MLIVPVLVGSLFYCLHTFDVLSQTVYSWQGERSEAAEDQQFQAIR
jgi:hypothetical protein